METAIHVDASINNSYPTTVVRIKRRLGTETPDSIYVSSKKKCLEASSSSDTPASSSTVLTKLTTVSEDDHLELHLKNALKLAKEKLSTKLRNSYKLGFHQPSKEEIRRRVKSEKAASKFKFICSKRNINLSDIEKEKLNIQLFDAVTENETPLSVALSKEEVITCNDEPMQSIKIEFVYDLYYTSNPVEHSTWIENICEVQPYEDKDTLVYDDDDEQNEKLESDDENDEDNWRNDYPDEDEEELLYDDEEDYLCKHFEKTKLGSDESYDADDYEECGDFDVDGNLVLNGRDSPFSTLKKLVRRNDYPKIGDSSSEEDEEY